MPRKAKTPTDKIMAGLKESQPFLHWGNWVKRRGLYLGYRRQLDLIREVGCERAIFYRWLRMEKPPIRMQKGFDVSLARALKTDRQMLFSVWRTLDPDSEAVTRADPTAGGWDEEKDMRRRINSIMEVLDKERLAKLLDISREFQKEIEPEIIRRAGGSPAPAEQIRQK